ncbi:hypothetical protein BDR06DRAFT_967638 [Suillus hirtellus]|nr:hypothetical protein BDR06DRAFT_967638 [Suillus hirtellus]
MCLGVKSEGLGFSLCAVPLTRVCAPNFQRLSNNVRRLPDNVWRVLGDVWSPMSDVQEFQWMFRNESQDSSPSLAWASQPKGSNSFDLTVPVNSVAPEPPHKGCRSHSKVTALIIQQKKQPPPPYHISEQPIPNATTSNTMIPNAKIPRAQPKAKATVPPSPSIETVKSQPTFIQCKDSRQFGFSPPIVPPGMDPDLQALNNLFMATAKAKHILSTSNASQSQLPGIVPDASGSCLVSGEDSLQMALSKIMTSTTVGGIHFYKSLDPALWPTVSQSTESKSFNSSKGEISSDKDRKDQQIGWGGAVSGYHSTHPGFSGEEQPSQPQYSYDEDNQVAEKHLVVNSYLSDSTDVRSAPEIPHPELLDLLQVAETITTNSKKSFLENAKGECCVQQALENPFLKLVEDLPTSIMESFSVSLLYDDLATWHSDLKKITIIIAPSAYDLVPSATIPIQDCATWIKEATIDLLENSMFLHNGVNKLRKTRNFAHPGLHKVAQYIQEGDTVNLLSSCLHSIIFPNVVKIEMENLSQSSLPRSMNPFTKQCLTFSKLSWKTLITVSGWCSNFVHELKLDVMFLHHVIQYIINCAYS